MKEKEILAITSGLAAQGYLLELLLLNLVNSQQNPSNLIRVIRFQLEAQLRDDAQRIGEVFPGIGATKELLDATMASLNNSLDRIAGQIDNPAPARHNA